MSISVAMEEGVRSSQYVSTMTARCWMLSLNTAVSTSGRSSGPSKSSGRAASVSLDLRRLEDAMEFSSLVVDAAE